MNKKIYRTIILLVGSILVLLHVAGCYLAVAQAVEDPETTISNVNENQNSNSSTGSIDTNQIDTSEIDPNNTEEVADDKNQDSPEVETQTNSDNSSSEEGTHDDYIDTRNWSDYHEASPIGMGMGIVYDSGFLVQPKPLYSVGKGEEISIRSRFIESVWGRLKGVLILKDVVPNYRWYTSTKPKDKKSWKRVSSGEPSHKHHDYTFSSTKEGKYYYFVRAYSAGLLGIIGNTHYDSKIAEVEVVDKPIKAKGFSARVEHDYIFNSKNTDNVTYAHGTTVPGNATGNITWEGDNESVAKVNRDTGEIQGNEIGAEGVVNITGTFTGAEGTIMKDKTKVTVGGGLNDVTVDQGKTAYFEVKGMDPKTLPKDYTTKWFQVDTKGRSEKISDKGERDLSLTLKHVKKEWNNYQYYCEFTTGNMVTNFHFKTNKARLYVNMGGTPKIEVKTSIQDLTYQDKNNYDKAVHEVIKGDELLFESELTNDDPKRELKFGKYKLPLHSSTKLSDIKEVKLDGKVLDNKDFKINSDYQLEVGGFEFTESQAKHVVSVKLVVTGTNEKGNFITTPFVTGQSGNPNGGSQSEEDGYMKVGNNVIIHFRTNSIKLSANNIMFGRHHLFQKDKVYNRENFNDIRDSVMSVDDQRREKSHYTLYVTQETPFQDESSKEVLPVSLRYYNAEGNYSDLSRESVVVPQNDIKKDTTTDCDGVFWEKDRGLKMCANEVPMAKGKYKAKVTWTMADTL
ncbi:hypothetical protein [Companilactobacillus mishanensis]|uniref:Uncharacterized protein n=1 Tax=Companilactobacillus mishanensis TaxID=2486008 RepID=A0ABW9P5F8_9LACO|nr:hypothetical protein [Companilactobacillus mishanensis]MQS44524.1 hypothetical protein [Companilactobacillus mishanensis]